MTETTIFPILSNNFFPQNLFLSCHWIPTLILFFKTPLCKTLLLLSFGDFTTVLPPHPLIFQDGMMKSLIQMCWVLRLVGLLRRLFQL